jgi:hypothetical protein
MMTGEQIIAELGSFDGAAEILQAWRDGMAPEPALLVSDYEAVSAEIGALRAQTRRIETAIWGIVAVLLALGAGGAQVLPVLRALAQGVDP